MIRHAAFHWFLLQFRFAEALGCRERVEAVDDASLWACHRLGLYKTVAESGHEPSSWRARLAFVASLAAVGRHEEAAQRVHGLVTERMAVSRRVAVAQALAPFAPELALLAADCQNVPVCLRAGLLLRTKQNAAAAELIAGAGNAKGSPHPAEFELLRGNVIGSQDARRLDHLNAFLKRHSLPPVALSDASLPPGPGNFRSANPLPSVRGPLVSILMTTYRTAARVEASLRSLLAQTYQDIEVIVVDDASDDSTWEVISAIAGQDSRVRCLRLPCNAGTYVAKHAGFLHAKGEFVTCHDSDDWAHPLRIQLQVMPLLRSGNCVCSTSEWVRMQDDGLSYARQVHPLQRLNPASPLFRKDLVRDRAGLWDAVRTGADSEFLARIKLVFGRSAVKKLALPLTFGSHRPDSLMTAVDTGHSTQRVSPDRLDYWEAWTCWHIHELRHGRHPHLMIQPKGERKYPAPESLRISEQVLNACLEASVSAIPTADSGAYKPKAANFDQSRL